MIDFIEVIKQNAKGRMIVVWGPLDFVTLKCYYILNTIFPPHIMQKPAIIQSLLLMSDKYKEIPVIKGIKVNNREILDKEKVYVVATSNPPVSVLKSKYFKEHIDYLYKTNGFLNYDCEWDGVFVGKWTTDFIPTFSNCLGVNSLHNNINSIGRYCAFNHKAYMNGDHKSKGLVMNQRFMQNLDLLIDEKKAYSEYLEPYNKISIGNDVWIGANVFINASKVKSIGNGAILGANAVVNEDVPPYSIVVGVPGKVKKKRFTEGQIEILERVQWWNWDDDMIKENADCFKDINVFFERFK